MSLSMGCAYFQLKFEEAENCCKIFVGDNNSNSPKTLQWVLTKTTSSIAREHHTQFMFADRFFVKNEMSAEHKTISNFLSFMLSFYSGLYFQKWKYLTF